MTSIQFLITTVFELYLMVVLLRLWLQWAGADFYNPFCQFIIKATNPVLKPLKSVMPTIGGFDLATLVLALLVAFAEYSILSVVLYGSFPWLAILFQSVMSIFQEAFKLLFWVLIIRALLSWISQGYNPFEAVLHQLTEPLLAPIRRLIPPIGGLDLSVLILLVGLQFLQILMGDLMRGFH